MRKISITKKEVEAIFNMIPKSAIFSVHFQKKTGEERKLTGRRGVYKYLSGSSNKWKVDSPENIITVFEMSKKQYRSFDVERVKEIHAARKVFVVEG